MPNTFLSTFKVDVTPPLGHALCGGWIKPASKIGTPLYCIGFVLQGPDAPIVMAAIDWTGVLNDAHIEFTRTIAKAAHTTPERVALQSVHQHNAPFVDATAQKLVSEQKDLPASFDVKWYAEVQRKVAGAIETSLKKTRPVTHVNIGQAKVDRIASNRRILGPDGKVAGWRGSSCKDPKLRDEPEGHIDPWLRSIGFWDDETRLAVLYWYATHPMSYYGDGEVNYDFVGIAREKMADSDGIPHIYFTGCAGNIAAGKYNDGAPQRRAELADRLHQAMTVATTNPVRSPLEQWEWRSKTIQLPPRKNTTEVSLKNTIANSRESAANRIRAAMELSYQMRCRANIPITLTGLLLNSRIRLLNLPGECFIEYQEYLTGQLPLAFPCSAAYGDGGPWYIPTEVAYGQGGYEVTASWVDGASEKILQEGINYFLRR